MLLLAVLSVNAEECVTRFHIHTGRTITNLFYSHEVWNDRLYETCYCYLIDQSPYTKSLGHYGLFSLPAQLTGNK